MNKREYFDLTNPQKSIWLTEQYYQNTNVNNICATVISESKLDLNMLNKAIKTVVENSDVFSIKLKEVDGQIKQFFEKKEIKDFEVVKLQKKEDINRLEQEMVSNVFNLLEKLYEIKLFFVENSNVCGCLINVNHIVSDSYTIGILCQNVMNTYKELVTNNADLKELPKLFQYKDYIVSEKNYIESEKFEKDKIYWNEKFDTLPELVSVPSNKKMGDNMDVSASRYEIVLSKDKTSDIASFCKNNKISVFNLFMASLGLYIYQINSANDFVIGTPILNRSSFAEKNTLGMFINIAPLKFSIKDDQKVSEFISSVATDSMGLLRHQKYSYQYILEDIRKKNNSSIPNLYNLVLSYQITKTNIEADIDYHTHWGFSGSNTNDITINMIDVNDTGELHIMYDYKNNKYEENDISLLNERLIRVVDQIISNKDIKVKDIEITTKNEQNKILKEFNKTKASYPKDKSIIGLIEKNVKENPDKIALVDKKGKVTYKELFTKVNKMANNISKRDLINEIVAVYMEKSINYIISILAIIKSGNTFMPISMDYPKDRINYMVENSGCKLVIGNKETLASIYENADTIDIEQFDFDKENEMKRAKRCENSYIIYTSGTTGKPKGVVVKESSLINHVFGVKNRFEQDITNKDIALSIANISFDASIQEIFIPLTYGAKLHLLEDNCIYNVVYLAKYIYENKITFAFIPPAILDLLYVELEKYEKIKLNKLLVGLQNIYNTSLNNYFKLNKNLKIHNGYGPTEATICCISYMYKEKVDDRKFVLPLGKPMDNCEIFILNKNGIILPPFTNGEIYISGDCLASGYLNQEEKTKEKFVHIESIDKDVYKTGDIAYYDNDGNYYFIGRKDNQVKLNGYRIELEEINSLINNDSNVISSHTIVYNKNQICSFIKVKDEEDWDKDEILKVLKAKLPYYMIPKKLLLIKDYPLTPNGKIDNKELEKIIISQENNREFLTAQTDTDKKIERILKDVLKIENVDFNSNIFELGGDSLSAIKLCSEIKNSLNIDFSVKNVFECKNISEISKKIEKIENSDTKNIILTSAEKKFYSLSSEQKGIYYTSKFIPNELPVYNVAGGIKLDCVMSSKKIEEIFNTLINRHASFRTYFDLIDGEIVQKIDDESRLNIEVFNAQEEDLENIFNRFNNTIEFEKAPLLKVKIVYLPDKKTVIFIGMHHIISDGASMGILIKEFCKLCDGKALEPLKFKYTDYVNFEKYFKGSEKYESNKRFWLKQFEDEIPILNLPTKSVRPSAFTYNGDTIRFDMGEELTNKIKEASKNLQVTPYMFLLSVYYVLLYKYTGQKDIVVGTPVSNRDIKEFSNIIGMFVNTLAIRKQIDSDKLFRDFLNEVKYKVLDCFEHQSYSFEELVKELNVYRDSSRNSVFDTMFIFQSGGMNSFEINGSKVEYYVPKTNTSKFDLTMEIVPTDDCYKMNIEYCTDLFEKSFIENMLKHYIELLNNVLNNTEDKISSLQILGIKEKNHILYGFNDTKKVYNQENYIFKMIDDFGKENPDYKAITFKNKSITYKELIEKSNSLANYLYKKNIKQGSSVIVKLPRSLELLISIIAVLKTGAAYIPVDPNFPKARIDYMVENSNSSHILTLDSKEEFDMEIENIDVCLDNEELYSEKELVFKPKVTPDSPAYIIYTSGSTGNPKGVVLPHKGITNLTLYLNDKVEYLKNPEGNMAIASITTVCFDIFIFETLISLQKGLNVVIADENQQINPVKMNKMFEENSVKAFQTTPSRMEILLDNLESIPSLKEIKYVTLAGEALTEHLKNRVKSLGDIKIYNGYGPTENTIFTTYTDVTDYTKITIGKSMYNNQIYIIDKDKNVCPVGIPGELCVCGDNVGIGYKNVSQTQKNSFTVTPVSKKRMYKTGDLAKFLDNGEIEYIGRIDNQIKLHGLRIELGEIENKILEFKNIKKAAILLQKDMSNREFLVAYITVSDKISVNKLREYLRNYLPKYMIPSYFEILDEFPYTPNGKIDKKQLPVPNIKQSGTVNKARNELDKKIIKIFEKLLNVTPIGITDNFFELGGDSLLAINLQIELMKITEEITFADIFLNPTVQELSDKIEHINDIVETLENTFDYLDCNTYIAENNVISKNIEKKSIGNILLAGVTGFLGSHILSEFLENEKGNVYCLIRPEKGLSIENKFLRKLDYYFGEKYNNLINERIFIIQGDISLPRLGLNDEDYNYLISRIDGIINCAAKVSHFGKYELFKKINVDGVKNIIDFCTENSKSFYHVSTTSISGNKLNEEFIETADVETKVFKEENFYINQNIDNVYVKSKFEAEKLIIKSIRQGLDGYIFRIGNIMGRYYDGKFQKNIEENAYINRIISFLRLKTIPEYFSEKKLEFTPVDYCAKSIIMILQNRNRSNRIFHILDNKYVDIKDLIEVAKKYVTDVNICSNEEFIKLIDSIMKTRNYDYYIGGIVSDIDKKGNMNLNDEIVVSSDFTNKYLEKIGFEWPDIDKKYLLKFFEQIDKTYNLGGV